MNILPDIIKASCSRWLGKTPAPLEFIIEALVPRGMVTLLAADGGAGKTLLMQLCCTCVCLGQEFLGKKVIPGGTVGVFAEDPDSVLHNRQIRINEQLNVDMESMWRSNMASYQGYLAFLWDEGKTTPFFHELEQQLATLNDQNKLSLLVLDNSALLFNGEESTRREVTQFINALNGLATRLNIAIILSTHTSKSYDNSPSRAASGSTAWVNAARSVLRLNKDTDDQAILKLIKANHTAPGEEIPLIWNNGVLTAEKKAYGTLAAIEARTQEQAFLEMFSELTESGYTLCPGNSSPYYPPKLMLALNTAQQKRLKKSQLERIMGELLRKKALKIEPYGPPSRNKQRVVKCA